MTLMLREDYLVRQMRDFARVMARILGLRDQGEYAEALMECENALRSVSGLDPRIVRGFRAADVMALMGTGGGDMGRQRVTHTAELLRAEAEILEAAGRPDDAAAERRQADELLRLLPPAPES